MSMMAGFAGDVESPARLLDGMLRVPPQGAGSVVGSYVMPFAESCVSLGYGGNAGEVEHFVRQPFVDEAVAVVLDGEIYNCRELRGILSRYHAFATDAAAEVVAKAYRRWGCGCLSRLEGVFALALYDVAAGRLLLARDRFGVRPLYYATHRGNLFFASGVRPLFAAGVPRCLSAVRWAGYMRYSSYGQAHETFWDGIYQLPAGFLLVSNGYSLQERRWYGLQDDVGRLCEAPADYLKALFAEELERCTNRCLSDVETCGFRIGRRVESQFLFRLALRGFYAGKVYPLQMIGGGEVPPGQAAESSTRRVLAELERMPAWIEEPFDGEETLVRSVLFRRAVGSGVQVLCSGVGLDVLWQDVWDESEVRYDTLGDLPLLSPAFAALATPPGYPHPFDTEAANMRYLDLCCERVPHILRFFSRSAAEVGVQVRLPFLSATLVALSFVLPRVCRSGRKRLFDEYTAAYYATRYERGEGRSLLPMWLGNGMKEWMEDALADLRHSTLRDWFDAGALQHLCADFHEGEPVDMALLWKCISLRQHCCAG